MTISRSLQNELIWQFKNPPNIHRNKILNCIRENFQSRICIDAQVRYTEHHCYNTWSTAFSAKYFWSFLANHYIRSVIIILPYQEIKGRNFTNITSVFLFSKLGTAKTSQNYLLLWVPRLLCSKKLAKKSKFPSCPSRKLSDRTIACHCFLREVMFG